ncbi:MAG: HPF/RaiA family ribosome-associated protein, partial [Bacteroidota bacterium]
MDIHITARHFKAHESLRQYAFDSLKKLERYYNGI